MELHEALRRCYEKRPYLGRTLRQEDIAEEVARRGRTMSQGQVSNYIRGVSADPPPVLVRAIEDLSGRPAGWIYVQAGLVALPQSVEEMIDLDPEIADEHRRPLKTMVKALKEEGRRSGSASSGGRPRRVAAS